MHLVASVAHPLYFRPFLKQAVKVAHQHGGFFDLPFGAGRQRDSMPRGREGHGRWRHAHIGGKGSGLGELTMFGAPCGGPDIPMQNPGLATLQAEMDDPAPAWQADGTDFQH